MNDGPQPVKFREATYVTDHIRGMFTPHKFEAGKSNDQRTPDEVIRDQWMVFLGKMYKRYLNPLLPHQSGTQTSRLKYRLAACIRTFLFGTESTMSLSDVDSNGLTRLAKIPLPKVDGYIFLVCVCFFPIFNYSFMSQQLQRTSPESSRTEGIMNISLKSESIWNFTLNQMLQLQKLNLWPLAHRI